MEPDVYDRMAELERDHWWFVARRTILVEVLTRLVGLPLAARTLEAGCGTGGNLAMLSRFGEVCAFEPAAQARRMARARGDFDVREGRLPDAIPFEPSGFDLVVALDVLEHVDEDLESMRALRNQLRPGGWALITVPAFSLLWSGHDVRHHHKRRYGRKELVERIVAAGLSPVFVTFFNSFLFPLIAGIRIVQTALRRTDIEDDKMPPRLVNRVLTAVFASERHLVGRVPLPFGVSLLAVARKPET